MTDALPLFWLEEFRSEAKIDFITIRLPRVIHADGLRLSSASRIDVHHGDWRDHRDDWITIHDPHRDDLQYLIDHHPEVEILKLEVAIDLFLRDGTNDPERLRAAHRHLTVNLFPQFQQQRGKRTAQGTIRKTYTDNGKISRDTMRTRSTGNTTYLTNSRQWELVKAYIKTLDNDVPVKGQHPVRLEITLSRGGCQDAGVNRVCLLPAFAKNIRSYLMPFFQVATGIKPKIARTRSKNPERIKKVAYGAEKALRKTDRTYAQYGAAAAAKHGQKIVIDRQASKIIGNALKRLREQLIELKLPIKSAELPERWGANSLMYQCFDDHPHLSL